MTNFRKLTTATAALTLGTLMSTTAFADNHSMKCSDYNALSADDQMAHAQEWRAGREAARDEARGDDGADVTATENASDDVEVDGGREEARDEAMGSDEDVVAMMSEFCTTDDSQMTGDFRHPSEDPAAIPAQE
ncbi:hypothetical protein DC366_14325 [Pelagivirga sediminicola]|uniref:Secreted protein n=2 Tax=Pelagivirga sediminicola TaxID=2170575 RepID=A0A2T7G4F0_9RHOB|nr:hypothetical protein DC366_14325 [Pelagivirga sediminicola]